MSRTKTVFIVGAGASCEAGLPSGAELKRVIAGMVDIRFERGYELTRGDSEIVEALRLHTRRAIGETRDLNAYLHAGRQIAAGLPLAMSIDNFLDGHRGNKEMELCGKIAIVLAILRAEENSQLRFDSRSRDGINLSSLSNTWYVRLWRLMSEGIAKDEVERVAENVAFITFNYDRCIEQFLLAAAQVYYALGEDDARQLVGRIPIHHLYGKIGGLPWLRGESDGMDFGYANDSSQVLKAASQIRTFTERFDDEKFLAAVHAEIAAAERIVFLGYAFHPQNMKLITPPAEPAAKWVLATAFGASESDQNVIKGQIKGLCRRNPVGGIEVLPAKCCEFFDHYWRSLSLA